MTTCAAWPVREMDGASARVNRRRATHFLRRRLNTRTHAGAETDAPAAPLMDALAPAVAAAGEVIAVYSAAAAPAVAAAKFLADLVVSRARRSAAQCAGAGARDCELRLLLRLLLLLLLRPEGRPHAVQGAKIDSVEGPQLGSLLESVGRAFLAFDDASRAADGGGLVTSGASGAGGARERDRCWGKVRACVRAGQRARVC